MTKISKTINRAIDKHLSETASAEDRRVDGRYRYSCDAIWHASHCGFEDEQIGKFLREMGCRTTSATQFDSFPEGECRQMARAIWLTWAAMIAEEEGL